MSDNAVAKETEFEFWGFVFVMLAAVMSGFRWTMTQILLQVGFCEFVAFLSLISFSVVLSIVCVLTLCNFVFVFPYPTGGADIKLA